LFPEEIGKAIGHRSPRTHKGSGGIEPITGAVGGKLLLLESTLFGGMIIKMMILPISTQLSHCFLSYGVADFE
jgi:hypothetical protein